MLSSCRHENFDLLLAESFFLFACMFINRNIPCFCFIVFIVFFFAAGKCIMLALRLNGPVQKTIKKIDLLFVAQFTHPHTRAQHATHTNMYVTCVIITFSTREGDFNFWETKIWKAFLTRGGAYMHARACVRGLIVNSKFQNTCVFMSMYVYIYQFVFSETTPLLKTKFVFVFKNEKLILQLIR